MLSQDGGKQSLEPGQLNWEQQRNLVNFLLALQNSRYSQIQRVWFPCLTRQAEKLHLELKDKSLEYSIFGFLGKNNPTDFMLRNLLDTESAYLVKNTDELEESIIKMVKNKENAGVSNNLKDATKKDKMIIFLKERILQANWKKHKRDNLNVIDNAIYMNNLCVPSYALLCIAICRFIVKMARHILCRVNKF